MARQQTKQQEQQNWHEDTVIAHEVAQFDALADDWWDEKGALAPLHRLNPARLEFIHAAAAAHFGNEQAPLRGKCVLDIGCGAGLLSEPLARMGAMVTGVDAAPAVIAAAQRHAAEQGLAIDYRLGSCDTVVAPSDGFDVVCALEIIEHVAEPAAFVRQCAALVRPGGLLILSTLNRSPKSFALGIVAAEYVLSWVPRGTHQWQQFVTPAELAGWVEREGASLCRLSGLVYRPLTQSFELDNADLSVNYLMAAVKNKTGR